MTLAFPPSPTTGQTFPSPLVPGQPSWVWDSQKWTSRGLANAMVSTSPLPPLNPRVGDLWFDPVEGNTYLYFDDGNSQQWVVTVNPSALDFPSVFNQPTINQPHIMGVTDGSDAAPGEVGEVISALNSSLTIPSGSSAYAAVSITLSPGDWDVRGGAYYGVVFTVGGVYISGNAGELTGATSYNQQMNGTSLVTGTVRRSAAVSRSVFVSASATYTGSPNFSAWIWARRVR